MLMKLGLIAMLTGILMTPWGISSSYATTAPITILGSITTSGCSINKNGPLDIDFGTLKIDEIGTSKGDKMLSIPLSCEGASLHLSLLGQGASFNSRYLETNMDDLAIRFSDVFDTEFPLNTSITLNSSDSTLFLNATLVAKSGGSLEGGAFNAAVSLVFQYS